MIIQRSYSPCTVLRSNCAQSEYTRGRIRGSLGRARALHTSEIQRSCITITGPRPAPALPATTDELTALTNTLFSREAAERGLAFRPEPSDVIITPHAKCGTTFLQQVAHQLRTRGDMDFDDISEVAPWIDLAPTLGQDLDAAQVARPRLFKSHVSWHDIPKGARYIVAFRHPRTAFESLYRFFSGFLFEPGSIDIETLYRWRFPLEHEDVWAYWVHLASWWERRDDPDVLLFCYEDMVVDRAGTIRGVAAHMDLDLDDDLFDLALERSSREFMLAHSNRFDEAPLRRHAAERGLLPFDIEARKVTEGTGSKADVLPPHLVDEIDRTWAETIAARFGLASYDALRAAVAHRQNGEPPGR